LDIELSDSITEHAKSDYLKPTTWVTQYLRKSLLARDNVSQNANGNDDCSKKVTTNPNANGNDDHSKKVITNPNPLSSQDTEINNENTNPSNDEKQ
jgi:hypothetical protein